MAAVAAAPQRVVRRDINLIEFSHDPNPTGVLTCRGSALYPLLTISLLKIDGSHPCRALGQPNTKVDRTD
jgi:hypothetical protein